LLVGHLPEHLKCQRDNNIILILATKNGACKSWPANSLLRSYLFIIFLFFEESGGAVVPKAKIKYLKQAREEFLQQHSRKKRNKTDAL
jgi:hypothetical protein